MISSDRPAEYLGPLTAIVLPESCECSSVCECTTLSVQSPQRECMEAHSLCVKLDKKVYKNNEEKRDFTLKGS